MMFSNPFVELSASISPDVMQAYVIIMFLCVVGGTLFDVVHKGSAKYFFENARRAREKGSKQLGGGDMAGIAVKTVAEDVLTSAEFCNPNRRIAHLLGMYGFVFFVLATVVMVFSLPGSASGFWSFLWHLGALMVCVGGFWFWFFIRVDVASEGNPWHRIVRADLFILSLVATTTSGLLWSFLQSAGATVLSALFLILFIAASTVLFGGVIWSKFAHMFFKPAAAFQKRVAVADGSLDNLPRPADRTMSEDSDRHSMELLKDAPLNMGLGIKREAPHHY
ncbi:MAG: adenylyl-sulfate reductase [Pseudomonadota bacterium]